MCHHITPPVSYTHLSAVRIARVAVSAVLPEAVAAVVATARFLDVADAACMPVVVSAVRAEPCLLYTSEGVELVTGLGDHALDIDLLAFTQVILLLLCQFHACLLYTSI